MVLAGYGPDPNAAIISLRHHAQSFARDLPAAPGARYEVVAVQLAAGEVPDASRVAVDLAGRHNPETRHATRPGWAAYGTLMAVPASAGGPAAELAG